MKKANSLSKIKLQSQNRRKSIISNIIQSKLKAQIMQDTQNKLNLSSSNSVSNFKSSQLNKSHQKYLVPLQKERQNQYNYTNNIQKLLLKAKSITQVEGNKRKINHAKKFKINHKQNAITFLTGLEITQIKPKQEANNSIGSLKLTETELDLKTLLNPQYDDLQQLRRMIKQTDKNLKSYKKQTLAIKKQVLNAGEKFNKNGYSLADLNYKKINIQIDSENQRYQYLQKANNKNGKTNKQIRVNKNSLFFN